MSLPRYRAGASAVIGSEILSRSAPDGHTIVSTSIARAANLQRVRKLPYANARELALRGRVIMEPGIRPE